MRAGGSLTTRALLFPLRALPILPIFLLAACKVVLFTEISEKEANKIVSVLNSYEISAYKESGSRSGGITVMIDEGDFSLAVRILEEKGLPSEEFATTEQVFPGSGLVTTPLEERARLQYVISQELSQTLSEIEGVLSARVHIVIPNEQDLPKRQSQETEKASASVVVRRQSNIEIQDLASKVKYFISNSVKGVEYEDVAVIEFVVPTTAVEQATPTIAVSEEPGLKNWPLYTIISVVLAALLAGIAFIMFRKGFTLASFVPSAVPSEEETPSRTDASSTSPTEVTNIKGLPERKVIPVRSGKSG